MIHGVINIYKEPGYTSHDVVAKLRGILRQKKIGHTGTLDPAAEGVLPVCLGSATRLCDLLTDKRKTYRAVMLLGRVTDTQDTTGTTLREARPEELRRLTDAQIREAASHFIGAYDQIPPMYSALKVNGQKLCDLARQGKEVERKARPVTIYRLDVESVMLPGETWKTAGSGMPDAMSEAEDPVTEDAAAAFPRITMTVECSKGTYIRTLCHDIGARLGCGGCMEKLIRTQVERFSIGDSLRLQEVEQLAASGRLEERVLPVEAMFDQYLAFRSEDGELDRRLHNGNSFGEEFCMIKGGDASCLRVYDSAGRFIGLYEYRAEKKDWKPKKMFAAVQNS